MDMSEDSGGNGSVRITNSQIFTELRQMRDEVRGLKQSMDETLKPQIGELRSDVRSLGTLKADRVEVEKISGRTEKLEMRVYAVLAGLIAAIAGLNGIGII